MTASRDLIRSKIFTDTYEVSDFITDYKAMFPVYSLKNITDSIDEFYLGVALDMLPQRLARAFPVDSLKRIVSYAISHLICYFDVANNPTGAAQLQRVATSMSADGLSISFAEIEKFKNDAFSNLQQFFATTAYGTIVNTYIEKISGIGGVGAA